MLKLFGVIIKSYIWPRSKNKWYQEIPDVHLPNFIKVFALLFLILTVLVWMGIKNGLNNEFKRFKKDPYTTSISARSDNFSFDEKQIQNIQSVRYKGMTGEFNFSGKGEPVLTDIFPFSSIYLVFYAKDGKERKIFSGRTVSKSDRKILEAIHQHLIHKNLLDYDLLEKWDNNEKGIIVSSNLIERLGYEIKKQLKINYMIDLSYKNQTISFSVPLKILAVADRLPHGDFIVSNGFSYNYQVKRSFNPFKKVQQFYVLASHGRKNELKTFTNKQFKYVENIVEINENRNDGKIKYRIEFEDIPSYEKKDFEALCRESSKYSIKEKLKNSGFVCLLDYYEWRNWEKASKNDYSDLVTLYLQEEYVDLLPELSLFLKENAGVEMDDSVINVFKNYHKDMARFKRISIILYLVLILLGIFISMAVYIKSVQATMHRLGVFSAFGVSPSFLSSVLAVESILIFLLSLLLAVGLHFIFPPILNHYGITTALIFSDILKVFLVGTFLCFIFVFFTVKFILKKQPYSLMNYRS